MCLLPTPQLSEPSFLKATAKSSDGHGFTTCSRTTSSNKSLVRRLSCSTHSNCTSRQNSRPRHYITSQLRQWFSRRRTDVQATLNSIIMVYAWRMTITSRRHNAFVFGYVCDRTAWLNSPIYVRLWEREYFKGGCLINPEFIPLLMHIVYVVHSRTLVTAVSSRLLLFQTLLDEPAQLHRTYFCVVVWWRDVTAKVVQTGQRPVLALQPLWFSKCLRS